MKLTTSNNLLKDIQIITDSLRPGVVVRYADTDSIVAAKILTGELRSNNGFPLDRELYPTISIMLELQPGVGYNLCVSRHMGQALSTDEFWIHHISQGLHAVLTKVTALGQVEDAITYLVELSAMAQWVAGRQVHFYYSTPADYRAASHLFGESHYPSPFRHPRDYVAYPMIPFDQDFNSHLAPITIVASLVPLVNLTGADKKGDWVAGTWTIRQPLRTTPEQSRQWWISQLMTLSQRLATEEQERSPCVNTQDDRFFIQG